MREAMVGLCSPETPFRQAMGESLARTPGLCLQEDGPLDLFVCVLEPGPTGEMKLATEPVDLNRLADTYERCALGVLRQVNAALPRLQAGQGKRLCFVTSVTASVNLARDTGADSSSIVLAAANMAIRTLFNSLRPLGYTFRVFASRGFDPADAPYAVTYFLRDRSNEPESPEHSDENRLVMRNRYEQEIPW